MVFLFELADMSGPDYEGKRVLVVGAARSGIAAARFLLSRRASVVLTDQKPEAELRFSLDPLRNLPTGGSLLLELGGLRPASFGACDLVVTSPGVPLSHPCFAESRRAGIPVIAEVELAFRHLKGRILGITGSNGKTTTTALAAAFLQGGGLPGHAAGNIGIPLIGFADASADADLYATELSSFQLEGIDTFRPAVAALLNLTPDHLDRYSSLEDYTAAKRRIFMNQDREDFAVLNADDPSVAALAASLRSSVFCFSRREMPAEGVYLRGERIFGRRGGAEKELFALGDIQLVGAHNLENVLAASAVALLAGTPPESLRPVLRDFRGVEHRLEWVADIDGVRYFNDSKATNVDAAVKSIEAFERGVWLIAGGRDKGADFKVLRPLVRERVRQVVLIGEAAAKLEAALDGAAAVAHASDLAEALALCRRGACPGETVLLAPACASFDMFESYEHRGRVFKELVRALERRS
jgi:UDP-N-acetylmuramoylalanine--D-glutamate ligase